MTRKATILFIDKVLNELKQYLIEQCKHLPVEFFFSEDKDAQHLHPRIKDVDIIIGWSPTKDLLINAENVSLYINPGAGVQHLITLFKEISQERSITLVNGHGNAYFTAQHGVALLLSLLNKVPHHHQWLQEGKWRTGDKEGASIPLKGRHIGLLGYGAINQKIHQFLQGFDVKFSILTRTPYEQPITLPITNRFTINELHTFLKTIETLIIAIPSTTETIDLIGEEELRCLGKHGVLVNIARGNIISEKPFFEALKTQQILGAAIDVWYDYSPKEDESKRKYPYHFPFHTLENVVLSPHRAASPFSDLERWNEVIENITRFTRGENRFINTVNLEREY